MSGKLIVLEGTDGVGKTTQVRLMAQCLEREGVPFRQVKFPRYGSPFAAPVERYLQGDLGKRPGDVSAYAASTLYAVDRYASYKQDWGGFYEAGGLVVCDRYTTSNAVHQGSKLPEEERPAFWTWLEEFEYGRLGLPVPDKVFWMDMPVERAVENLRRREADTHTSGDIHEADTAYLRACYAAEQQAAAHYGWQAVPCMDAGRLRAADEIHEEIMNQL